ncbi:MAG: hypothetical protein ACFE0I_24295 [Elainellaceae cyanobacterium]
MTILTLGLGGCGFISRLLPGGDQTAVDESAQQPAESPTDQVPADGEGFEEPVVEEESSPIGNVPPDLIASTDPNQRAANVRRDRADPFALLPTTPTVEVPQEEPQPQRPAPSQPTTSSPSRTSPPGALAPIPELVPRNTQPSPPPPPQPNLARAVEVSGVVQIGSVPYAILNAPNEPHSRYVRSGQRLSNGQVLVKRIEVIPGLEPVVILEENGIEVVREVTGPRETETATATTESTNPAI